MERALGNTPITRATAVTVTPDVRGEEAGVRMERALGNTPITRATAVTVTTHVRDPEAGV